MPRGDKSSYSDKQRKAEHIEASVASGAKTVSAERLEELLADLLKRRDGHTRRLRGRVAELRKQAADAEAKPTRLYEAI